MTYITEFEEYGRKVPGVDLCRFAADLATLIGGTVRPPEPDDSPARCRSHVQIDIGGDRLSLTSNTYQKRGRVTVDISAPEIPWGDRCTSGDCRTPEATVDPERPLPTIARDLKRRVFDAARAPLARQRAFAKECAERRAAMAAAVAELNAHPHLSADMRDGGQWPRGAVHHRAGAASIYGELREPDRLYLRDLSLTRAQFLELVAILNREGGE